MFPSVDVIALLVVLGSLLVGALAVGGLVFALRPAGATDITREARRHRDTWRMPPLAFLDRPEWSRGRLAAMWSLRIYLVVAVAMLLVKAVQLGAGAH